MLHDQTQREVCSLRRRKLSFTRAGRYLVAIALGVGLSALNTGNNLLYLVLALLLALVVVSGVISELTIRALKPSRDLPSPVYAGQAFLTGVTLTNQHRWMPAYGIHLLERGAQRGKRCYFLRLPAQTLQTTSYRAQFKRRGLHRYEGLELSTGFPFGFFIKHAHFHAPAEVLVLPKIDPVRALPPEAAALMGIYSAPRAGAEPEFFGLTAYREGDDARSIHWARSASAGRLVLREGVQPAQRRLTVTLDTRRPASASDDEMEAAVSLAASMLSHLHGLEFEVSLQLSDAIFNVAPQHRASLFSALRALALLDFLPPEADATSLGPASEGHRLLICHRLLTERAAGPFVRVLEVG